MKVGPKLLAQEAYNPGLFASLKFNSPFVGGSTAVLMNFVNIQGCHPLEDWSV